MRRNSSDIWRVNHRKRRQALNFSDRAREAAQLHCDRANKEEEEEYPTRPYRRYVKQIEIVLDDQPSKL